MTTMTFIARDVSDAAAAATQCAILPLFQNAKLTGAALQLDRASSGAIKAALALGGRTLVLTTSLRALQLISEALATAFSGSGSIEERPFTRDEKALFRDGSKNILLRVGDIQVLEASEAYTRLILGDGRGITINGTLKSVRDRLDPDLFFSASRSQAINLDHVANVEDIEGGFMILTMANGVKVELSRRHSGEFRRLKSV